MDRFGNIFIDPRQFGAKGNDKNHNDSPGIQAAIDFYCSNVNDEVNSYQGGRIIFPNSTFYLDDPVYVRRGLILTGSGSAMLNHPYHGGTLLLVRGERGLVFEDRTGRYITVEDMTIHGGDIAIDVNRNSHIWFNRVTVGGAHIGVKVFGGFCVDFRNSVFWQNDIGVDMVGSTNSFRDCSIWDNKKYNVKVGPYGNNILFDNCNIESHYKVPLDQVSIYARKGSSTHVEFRNCHFEGGKTPVITATCEKGGHSKIKMSEVQMSAGADSHPYPINLNNVDLRIDGLHQTVRYNGKRTVYAEGNSSVEIKDFVMRDLDSGEFSTPPWYTRVEGNFKTKIRNRWRYHTSR